MVESVEDIRFLMAQLTAILETAFRNGQEISCHVQSDLSGDQPTGDIVITIEAAKSPIDLTSLP